MTYKLPYYEPDFPGNVAVIKLEDGSNPLYITEDEYNPDYVKYLAWVAEGNTPEPAEEATE
tara:strand:- start:89 stop:271 length:183 start_codon:yes stop_codon:yes gene_type:complete